MNKPKKPTSQITHPDSLLNKFIIYKYHTNLTLHYIYKVDGENLFVFSVNIKDIMKFPNFQVVNIVYLNDDVLYYLKDKNPYFDMCIL